jgi:hypothetical protein
MLLISAVKNTCLMSALLLVVRAFPSERVMFTAKCVSQVAAPTAVLHGLTSSHCALHSCSATAATHSRVLDWLAVTEQALLTGPMPYLSVIACMSVPCGLSRPCSADDKVLRLITAHMASWGHVCIWLLAPPSGAVEGCLLLGVPAGSIIGYLVQTAMSLALEPAVTQLPAACAWAHRRQ